MRDAAPGMLEYELQADAEFVFKKHGAYGPSYFALIATGPNTCYSHYHKNTARAAGRRSGAVRLRARLQVLPVGRHARLSGQRQVHARASASSTRSICELYQALMTSIEVHAAPRDIIATAVMKMDRVIGGFTSPIAKIKEAAAAFVERYRTSRRQQPGAFGRHGGARRRRPDRRRSSPARCSPSSRRCRFPTSTSASGSRT